MYITIDILNQSSTLVPATKSLVNFCEAKAERHHTFFSKKCVDNSQLGKQDRCSQTAFGRKGAEDEKMVSILL